ncbi:MAG: Gfo/Idh/MocA family protein, partial [Brevinema sp.]
GTISPVHIKSVGENLAAVCDIDPSKSEQFPDTPFYTDYKAMLASEKLDCVHICLPHHLHYECTLYCINQKIPVFLEKPMGLTSEEGLKIQQMSSETGVPVCVCYQNRFNPTTEKLIEEISSNKYGRFLGIKGIVTWFRPISYYQLAPWRGSVEQAGGGVLNNQSIHTLDLMYYVGGEIESVSGHVTNFLDFPLEVEDTATAHFRFKNGGTGIFFATVANATNSSVELEVTFEQAVFEIKHGQLWKHVNEKDRNLLADDALNDEKHFYYGNSHTKLIHLFYEHLQQKREIPVDASEGIASLKMIEKIRESSSLAGKHVDF